MEETDILLTYSFNASEVKALYRLLANIEAPERPEAFFSALVTSLYKKMSIEEAEWFFNE
jgi:hypothetical protein